MADNQGQTITAPVNTHPAPAQNEAPQQTTPMLASPQPDPAQNGQNPQPYTQAQPLGLASGPANGPVQQLPYGSTPPPMTFEVPAEHLASGPVPPGTRSGSFSDRLRTPLVAAVAGGVLLLGVGFATGYVVGHDRGASSVSGTTDGQTGFGGQGGPGGQGGFPGQGGTTSQDGTTGQGQSGQGQTGQGQTWQSSPFGQSQDGTTQDGTTQDGTSQFGTSQDGTSQFGDPSQSGQSGTTTQDGTDLSQTQ